MATCVRHDPAHPAVGGRRESEPSWPGPKFPPCLNLMARVAGSVTWTTRLSMKTATCGLPSCPKLVGPLPKKIHSLCRVQIYRRLCVSTSSRQAFKKSSLALAFCCRWLNVTPRRPCASAFCGSKAIARLKQESASSKSLTR